MGSCCASCCSHAIPLAEDSEYQIQLAHVKIESSMHTAETIYRRNHKLLLLGTGASGKSTIFKTLKVINEGALSESELKDSLPVIRQNCVAGILNLLKNSQKLYEAHPQQYHACLVQINDEIKSAIQIVVNFGCETFNKPLDEYELEQLSRAIFMLWSLESIRETFACRGNKYSFPDNMDYFFDKIVEIMTNDYIPTQQDMMKTRVRTTGIIKYEYIMKGTKFTVYDVGGQRNERNKWMHSFENVAAVLFVTALNHYNSVLFEDETKNGMLESLQVFEAICNSKWFRKCEMILFLNKDDLFREKLKLQIPLSTCFSHDVGWNGKQWDGPNYTPIIGDDAADKQHYDECYEAAIKFIQDAFIALNKFPHRVIFCHVTCATDQDTVEKVFWDVQNIVIRSNLRRGGLV